MSVVFEDEFLRVEHDAGQKLVRVRRSATPIPPNGDATTTMGKLRLALLPVDRSKTGLLIDMRLAPLRNDETIERVTQSFQDVVRGFRRAAVLVRTATGLLQAGRTAREGATDARPFLDEGEALAYLRSG